MATNNSVNEGTAASGKVLQGQGVGTTSAFSTSTYPSTATTTGQILRADGTNWSGTTATYPNTAGSSGNVLTSDGTNWSSSAAPGAGLLFATVTLTSAQIKALHATPIQIVAAPGTSKTIIVVNCASKFTYGGTNQFTASASQEINLFLGTVQAVVPTGSGPIFNAALAGSATKIFISAAFTTTGITTTNAENLALNAYNSVATEITGNAANDNTVTINVIYYIASY